MSFATTHAVGDDSGTARALFWDQDWLRSRGDAFISAIRARSRLSFECPLEFFHHVAELGNLPLQRGDSLPV
jgi:hypothetical protein